MNGQHGRRLRALFLVLALGGAAPCLAQTPAVQAPTPEAMPPKVERADATTGTITGRVVGEGGEPLAGVAVYAAPRATLAPAGRRLTTATTEDDGSFALNDIAPGVYSITAAMPGYVNEIDALTGRPPGSYRPGDTATVRLFKGGVITGRVTDAQGEPVVGLGVRAFRIRDPEGRPSTPGAGTNAEDKTDDRGVYRIYGLAPGAFVVMAGGRPNLFGGPFPGPYDADAPTFYPSATRDTAAEITVRTGQEASGIDIRYRDEPGRRVTGRVEGAAAQQGADGSIALSLVYASTNLSGGNTFIPLNSDQRSFSIDGVADGEYELHATVNSREGVHGSAPAQRVSVRGADVTGLRVVVSPLASVTGKLVVEPAGEAEKALPECKTQQQTMPSQEVVVVARRERAAGERPEQLARRFPGAEGAPDREGSFTLRSLEPGRYRLSALPTDEAFYVRDVRAPSPAPAAAQPSAPRRAGSAAAGTAQPATAAASNDVVNLASGQQLSGVTIRLAPGAASLGGVVAGRPGAPPPVWTLQSRVYLVPSERERADDPVRYAEAVLASDGSFAFKNLAPGRYRLLAREAGADTAGPLMRPAFRDADARAQLRRDAETSGAEVELKPCQRLTDFTLRLQ
ncbi:MAG TPA: carboxypeptidase-like regulatory domain-containing protein [Pyrinomonadaceae bacterium]|nr:carboxypeptidase-like regulatory domain-containing protein [Pyrinomonadaceae bacterium]